MGKTVNLNLPGVMELGREELREVDGGLANPWTDLFWLVVEDAAELWVDTCNGLQDWAEGNPDQVMLYRSLHH